MKKKLKEEKEDNDRLFHRPDNFSPTILSKFVLCTERPATFAKKILYRLLLYKYAILKAADVLQEVIVADSKDTSVFTDPTLDYI